MKIAILGTKGIPNNYGGFEQFAEYLSAGLVAKGHEVSVYNPHLHPFKGDSFKGVRLIKVNSLEHLLGGMANFLYDYYCLRHALDQHFDIIYEAGYGTASPFYWLLKKPHPVVLTNMDGLEWKRSKWNFLTRRLMHYFERLAVRRSDHLVADNIGIQAYIQDLYNVRCFYLPYGADLVHTFDKGIPARYGVEEGRYYMLIARMEPENNVEMILEAYVKSALREPFLVIGNHKRKYGRYLYRKFARKGIRFLGAIYEKEDLDSLRSFCRAYLHGHSVGGTNPSLLEAMAARSFIVAHANPFNKTVLTDNALYFSSAAELSGIFMNMDALIDRYREAFLARNWSLIGNTYSWNSVVQLHEQVFEEVLKIKTF